MRARVRVCVCNKGPHIAFLLFTAGPEMKLEEIINDNGPSGQRVKLAAGRHLLFDFCTGEIGECNAKLDILKLEDMYKEKYLLAYTANKG